MMNSTARPDNESFVTYAESFVGASFPSACNGNQHLRCVHGGGEATAST